MKMVMCANEFEELELVRSLSWAMSTKSRMDSLHPPATCQPTSPSPRPSRKHTHQADVVDAVT